jgi:hypothetical protein
VKDFICGLVAYLHEALDRFEIFFINLIEWAFLIAFGYVAMAAIVLFFQMIFSWLSKT